ncbi:MAG: hypothetical protein FD138_4075 [Planctomycetota bacterium]|nr:MAG: hypothetical protein FD138_4075 [Planctomycetota bacterium]
MAFLLCGSIALTAVAQDAKPTTVLGGIDNPCGVAVQAATGHVFIAAHSGVHRLDPKSGKAHVEISGFPTDIYGKGPKYNIGPLRPDGDELVRIYKVGKDAAHKDHEPIKEDAAVATLGPIKASEESAKGEGNFYGVASNGKSIFITCNGDDTKGWIAKSTASAGKPGALKLSIATKVATEVDAPVPVIFSLDGKDLVVGQMGEVSTPPGDSLLSIYDPETGKLKKNYKTGLNDIAGLAYSPKTKKLYATDYSWSDPKAGGLFRLDVDGDTVKATKIASLDKPTALAFDKAGVLYVAVFGTVAEGSTKPAGSLLKFDSGL